MDSNDLERERGITILAKNTAIQYGDTKINIVDTPGHADFGGEVERILKMVNGVILLVDAAEGPMPQTRFVLQQRARAGSQGHRRHQQDRPPRRSASTRSSTRCWSCCIELDATDEQLDSPMLFCSGRNGTASYSPDVPGTDLKPLFDTILDYIPAPEVDLDAAVPDAGIRPLTITSSSAASPSAASSAATLKQNQEIAVCNYHDPDASAKKAKAVSLYQFDGLSTVPVDRGHRRQHRRHVRHWRHHDRRHHLRARLRRAAALREDLRAHGRDDLLRQRQPLRRTRGQVRHLPPAARAPVPRDCSRTSPCA